MRAKCDAYRDKIQMKFKCCRLKAFASPLGFVFLFVRDDNFWKDDLN